MRTPKRGTLLGTLALAALLPAAMLQTATPAAAESVVTVMRTIDTDRYDPHKSTARSTAEALFMVGDTLVSLDPDLKTVHPLLAKSWTVSDDGKLYTFKLRDDVTFCSGKKFTAKDVKASIDHSSESSHSTSSPDHFHMVPSSEVSLSPSSASYRW